MSGDVAMPVVSYVSLSHFVCKEFPFLLRIGFVDFLLFRTSVLVAVALTMTVDLLSTFLPFVLRVGRCFPFCPVPMSKYHDDDLSSH